MLKYMLKMIGLVLVLFSAQVPALSTRQLEAPFVLLPKGETVSLASLAGKPLYLKFWATWCQSCLQQMPHFQKVQESLGKDIHVIAVNVGLEDSAADVAAVAERFGLSMTMAMDHQGALAQALGLQGTPWHLLFDPKLNLLHAGHDADEALDQKLKLLSSGQSLDFLSAEPIRPENAQTEFQPDSEGLHLLYFSATWCDWYLKESRPSAADNCERAQFWLNSMSESWPKGMRLNAYMSRLWADQAELEKYNKKYQPIHPVAVDRNNTLFHRYQVKHLPTLIILKDGVERMRVSDFSQPDKLKALEARLLTF